MTMSILHEAHGLVHGDRGHDYGAPLDDFSRTAQIWSAILGTHVTERQVALCMIGVKVSRLCNSPDKRDSVVDIAGYAETYQMCTDEIKRRAKPEIAPVYPATPFEWEITADSVKARAI